MILCFIRVGILYVQYKCSVALNESSWIEILTVSVALNLIKYVSKQMLFPHQLLASSYVFQMCCIYKYYSRPTSQIIAKYLESAIYFHQ